MPSIEEHQKIVKELIDDIEEKIRLGLVVQRQKIIGFAVSEAATNLFAIFLHEHLLIPPGFHVNHSFFASEKRSENTFSFAFNHKEDILKKLVRIEELRNRLCYGRDKEAREAEEAIELLFALQKLLEEKM
ncbi:MAG: hypothetical protein AABY00_00755 [Nanoarchaeota archaeon]